MTLGILIFLSGCATKPLNINPIQNFDVNKYMGRWYEIARIDSFLKDGMDYVYSDYHLDKDGTISVLSSGLKAGDSTREYVEGEADLAKGRKTGFLEISFIRPFYSDYIVFKVDGDYQYSYVGGSDKNHIWLFSKTPTVPEDIREDFLARANSLGYDVTKLVWVQQ